MVLFSYILRNLGRKKKQTLFSTLCISVSSLVILADFALLNGMEARLKEAVNEVISGQVTVFSSDDERINILEAQLKDQKPFVWGEEEQSRFEDEFSGLHLNRRIRIGSLISYGDETSYVNFHALEEEALKKVNEMLVFRKGGMAEKKDEVVISEAVAEDLNCAVGDTVLLVANNLYDYMSDAIGIVSGIFEEKGLAIFLTHNGFMPYESGMVLAETGEGESLELVINPDTDRDLSPKEIAALRQAFNNYFEEPFRLASWEQTVPLFYSIIKVWQGGGVITQLLFLLFSLIILITLTSLIVYSRRKELGTLRAIGFSRNQVKRLLCAEYALLCMLSVGLGFGILQLFICLLGADGVSISSKDMQSALMTDRLYPFLRVKDLLYVLFLFTLTTLISTLISVRKFTIHH